MNTILTSRGEKPERVRASAVKNAWGQIREAVMRAGTVVITTRERDTMVLMSVEEYRRLRSIPDAPSVEALERAFDERLERMQEAGAGRAVDAVFNADSREFSRAAIESLRQREHEKDTPEHSQ